MLSPSFGGFSEEHTSQGPSSQRYQLDMQVSVYLRRFEIENMEAKFFFEGGPCWCIVRDYAYPPNHSQLTEGLLLRRRLPARRRDGLWGRQHAAKQAER
jgi:hypothetical protein